MYEYVFLYLLLTQSVCDYVHVRYSNYYPLSTYLLHVTVEYSTLGKVCDVITLTLCSYHQAGKPTKDNDQMERERSDVHPDDDTNNNHRSPHDHGTIFFPTRLQTKNKNKKEKEKEAATNDQ